MIKSQSLWGTCIFVFQSALLTSRMWHFGCLSWNFEFFKSCADPCFCGMLQTCTYSWGMFLQNAAHAAWIQLIWLVNTRFWIGSVAEISRVQIPLQQGLHFPVGSSCSRNRSLCKLPVSRYVLVVTTMIMYGSTCCPSAWGLSAPSQSILRVIWSR